MIAKTPSERDTPLTPRKSSPIPRFQEHGIPLNSNSMAGLQNGKQTG